MELVTKYSDDRPFARMCHADAVDSVLRNVSKVCAKEQKQRMAII